MAILNYGRHPMYLRAGNRIGCAYCEKFRDQGPPGTRLLNDEELWCDLHERIEGRRWTCYGFTREVGTDDEAPSNEDQR